MSEYECFHPECDYSTDSKQGRSRHFGNHDDAPEIALWMLSCADEKPNYDTCSDVVGLSSAYYERKFDSWNSALERVGWELSLERNISDQKLIDSLKEFADESGRARYKEMNSSGPYSARLYELRFGSWERALEKAGLERYDPSGKNNPFWKGGDAELTCDNCGDVFAVPECHKHRRRHCCQDCYLNVISDGDVERRYTSTFYENRPLVFERDGGCIICGYDKDDGSLDAHHISPLKYFPEKGGEDEAHIEENLVFLCRKHHRELEGKFKGCEAKRFKRKAKGLYE